MKSSLGVCCGLIALAAANAVAAGPFDRELRFQPFVQAQQGARSEPQREAPRPEPQRDTRGSGDADRGRMNSDERRQLRRDIQDAGKDIYQRERPPAGMPQRR